MKVLFTICFTSVYLCLFSQSPEGINYQAVIRDNLGSIIPNQAVGIKIQVLQNSSTGSSVYSESFNVTTSPFGLVNIVIGQGTIISGTFSSIDWSNGPYFIEISADENGGTSYSLLGTQQLMSVPYSLFSETAENVINDQVNDNDSDSTNEIQSLSISNDTLFISNSNNVYIGSSSASNSQYIGNRKSIGKVGAEAWSVPGWSIEYTTGGYIYANRIYYTPIFVSDTTTYTGLGIQMSSNVNDIFDLKVGLYSWANGLPDTLVDEFGTFYTNLPSGHIISDTFTLSPGYYFLSYAATYTPGTSQQGSIYPSSATRYSPPVSGKRSTSTGGSAGCCTNTDCVTLSIQDAGASSSIISNGFPINAIMPNEYNCICAIYFRE